MRKTLLTLVVLMGLNSVVFANRGVVTAFFNGENHYYYYDDMATIRLASGVTRTVYYFTAEGYDLNPFINGYLGANGWISNTGMITYYLIFKTHYEIEGNEYIEAMRTNMFPNLKNTMKDLETYRRIFNDADNYFTVVVMGGESPYLLHLTGDSFERSDFVKYG
jgi:hypothetical protein